MFASIKAFINKHKYKILAGFSFFAAAYFLTRYFQDQAQTKLSSFLQAVKQNKIKEVVVDNDTVFFRSEESQWFRTFLGNFPAQGIFSLIKDSNIVFSATKEFIPNELIMIASTCLTSAISFKYIVKELHQQSVAGIDLKGLGAGTNTFLEDYFGGEDIKEKFRQTIDFLKQPQKYEDMGARIRRGILFYGPPGTGKTMLARALAHEAGCQFYRVVASEFQEMFVGVGAKRVRELFAAARKCPQGCIIFVDEIDALGSRMNHLRDSHQTTTTINQFLNQMDGFNPTEKVVVVAATNRLDLVDHAILRSGRFDIKVHIPLPNSQQRKGILQKILDKKLGQLHKVQGQMISFIGQSAENWCGADLQALVNQSIYRAIAQNSKTVNDPHILEAYEELHKLR